MWYMQIPLVAALLLSLAIPGVIAILAFYLVRRKWPDQPSEDVKNAASWGAFRIGSIHALIVSLAFAGVGAQHNALRETVDNEALALQQLYRGVDQINSDLRGPILQEIAEYTRYVIDVEWPSLEKGLPLAKADLKIDNIRVMLMELARAEKEIIVPGVLFQYINDADNARAKRVFDINLYEPSSNLFWFVVILTLISTIFCFFVYPQTRITYLTIGVFAGINGVIFFVMLDFDRPFEGSARVEPTAIETVYQRTMAGA